MAENLPFSYLQLAEALCSPPSPHVCCAKTGRPPRYENGSFLLSRLYICPAKPVVVKTLIFTFI